MPVDRMTKAELEALQSSLLSMEYIDGDACLLAIATALALMEERDQAVADLARLEAVLRRADSGTLDHAADAESWRRQCEDARDDLLRMAAERDALRKAMAASIGPTAKRRYKQPSPPPAPMGTRRGWRQRRRLPNAPGMA